MLELPNQVKFTRSREGGGNYKLSGVVQRVKDNPHFLILCSRLWSLWRWGSSRGGRGWNWTCHRRCRNRRRGVSLRTSNCPSARWGNVKSWSSRRARAEYVSLWFLMILSLHALFSRAEPARTSLHNASHGARKHQIMERRVQNENRGHWNRCICTGNSRISTFSSS